MGNLKCELLLNVRCRIFNRGAVQYNWWYMVVLAGWSRVSDWINAFVATGAGYKQQRQLGAYVVKFFGGCMDVPAKINGLVNLNASRSHISIGLCVSAVMVFTLFFSGVSFAQNPAAKSSAKPTTEKEPIQIKLERKKVTSVGGGDVLVAATEAKPGEVLEEKAIYINQSKKNLRVDATLPTPQYTELIVSSVKPANAKASVDGTMFEAIPLKRKVKQANGVVLEQIVPVIEYRFLRWDDIELGPEKTFIVSARFKLTENAPNQSASPALPAQIPRK